MPGTLVFNEQGMTGLDLAALPSPVTNLTGVLPSAEELRSADVIFIMGAFQDAAHMEQLAGATSLVLPDGALVVVAYPGVTSPGLGAFLLELGMGEIQVTSYAQPIEDQHPEFAEYFAVFGRSSLMLLDFGEGEVLGSIRHPSDEAQPTSVCLHRGRGLVYVVPYRIAGGQAHFLRSLFEAVESHRRGAADVVPPFLSSLRLPGEQRALDDIARVESELSVLRDRATEFERFRLLLGPRGTGAALESLVIEGLNTIFADTPYRAVDRADVGVEDFWIVGPDGDVALAEVKGQNTHVRRDDVNQVDSHREALGERAQGLPGLLIVNIFRGQSSIEQRRLPVPDQIVSRAASSNVIILRTADLYNLIGVKFRGGDAAIELVNALEAGGGWLEVRDDWTVEVHS